MSHKPLFTGPPLAIISDIHSNLPALRAVLADIEARGIERVVCLGDVVGYGPDPVECWRIVSELCPVIIRGNHDQALNPREMARFHPRARKAIEWTRRRLEQEGDGQAIIDALINLPRSAREENMLFVHGSPSNPTMEYLLPGDAYDRQRMQREFEDVDVLAFNGHSHIPGVIERGSRFVPPEALGDASYRIYGRQVIINVGSVGQPRDGNPKACYLTVVDGIASYHRIAYDAESVCKRILAIPDLDPFLGQRLLAGY
jgi:diadenosine tetraphosphatase ApaH/serine/threonine PP2A family protein phosphatase